ncbi:hypothetical protein NQ315_004712 [Exocentrus adspersus]|uniref:Uncharacterized protein n=1 Tax=Exocentrus adspersus TaxID=1586481 RepID=A0AAV8W1P9_9CUCU|nr:hypothetical protein NQ315_004712 [Exocentrus adspersus]
MFKRNDLPQRELFKISKEELMEDIGAITNNQSGAYKHFDYKLHKDPDAPANKLYWCLDQKPPQEYRFSQLEEFLTGTNNLEVVSETLVHRIEELEQIKNDITEAVEDVKQKAARQK